MTKPENSVPKEEPEARWIGEGGSGQHFAHTDEPEHHPSADAGGFDPFAPRGSRDERWGRFNATYGHHYGTRFVGGRVNGNVIERNNIVPAAQRDPKLIG
jgi:hypothetical protein